MRFAQILVLGLSLPPSGCSVAGLVVGGIADDRAAYARAFQLEPGTRVEFRLDDARVRGRLLGWRDVGSERYAEVYRAWRDSVLDAPPPPRLGEKVTVDLSGRRFYGAHSRSGTFAGFDPPDLLLGDPSGTRFTRLRADRTFALQDASGSVASRETLAEWTRRAPRRNTFALVASGPDTVAVKATEIRSVQSPRRPTGRLTGLLVGLALDGWAVLSWVVASLGS